MKILVAVKRVVDYNVKIRVKEDGSDVDLTHVKMSTNPFCEIAVEEAVRLKERGQAKEVVVVSIGDAKVEEQVRAALAQGADRGILVKTASGQRLSSLNVAHILKAVVAIEKPDLILLGKQAIDSDNNQTGQMLAGLCRYAQGTFASAVTLEPNRVQVTREIDGGLQTLSLCLPAVITADLRLNEPRFCKLPDIMKAKRKPLQKLSLDELSVSLCEQSQLLAVEPPPQRQAGIKVASVAQLVDKLKNEAKVIS